MKAQFECRLITLFTRNVTDDNIKLSFHVIIFVTIVIVIIIIITSIIITTAIIITITIIYFIIIILIIIIIIQFFSKLFLKHAIKDFIIWLTDFACCDWSIPGP